MGCEAQVSTPCSAYPHKLHLHVKSAMTEYSLPTKQTLQPGAWVPRNAKNVNFKLKIRPG